MAIVFDHATGGNVMLNALVYTQTRAVELGCSSVFAELTLDWTMLREPEEVSAALAKQQFDLLVLDLDSTDGSGLLLNLLASASELKSVVLAVSSKPVDASLLETCYRTQVYYPVRLRDIEDAVHRALPFAEALCEERGRAMQHGSGDRTEAAGDHRKIFREDGIDLVALALKCGELASAAADTAKNMLRMRHSLSVVAHERLASAISAIGTIWYVHEATSNFIGLQFIEPPSAGPTDLIALSVLLWLCAKSRRVRQASMELAQ